MDDVALSFQLEVREIEKREFYHTREKILSYFLFFQFFWSMPKLSIYLNNSRVPGRNSIYKSNFFIFKRGF